MGKPCRVSEEARHCDTLIIKENDSGIIIFNLFTEINEIPTCVGMTNECHSQLDWESNM